MKKILVVEDNALNKKLFCDILDYMGYRVISTSEGREVISLVLREKPDLIIMDVHIPHISGLELTRLIKQDADLRKIPIIAVTAYAMKGELEMVTQSGCDDWMIKPISVADFRDKVKKYLDDMT